jgi:hypothetical protein
VADLYEAARQNVQQEAAKKLDRIKRHDLLLVPVRRIPPPECNASLGK